MQSPHRSLAKAFAIAGAIALTASACSSAEVSESDADLRVVATTTQMGDIAREIAGDAAEITQLMQPGGSAHGFDPTPASLQALATADAVVMNGAGLEEWLAPVLDSSGFDGLLIDASEDLALSGSHDHDHDHDHEDGDDHEDHHDHGHDDADPHVWTDPANVIVMAQTVGDNLAGLAGDDAENIEASTASYIEQLEALQAWMGEAFATVQQQDRLLVTTHDSFHYLAEAYDITAVGSLLPSFDDNTEVSAAAIDRLVAEIEASGTVAIFSDSQLPADLANTIAGETDVTVYSGEQSLYTDSLGQSGSPGETYIGSQIHNTTVLVEAWGGEVPELPEAIS